MGNCSGVCNLGLLSTVPELLVCVMKEILHNEVLWGKEYPNCSRLAEELAVIVYENKFMITD